MDENKLCFIPDLGMLAFAMSSLKSSNVRDWQVEIFPPSLILFWAYERMGVRKLNKIDGSEKQVLVQPAQESESLRRGDLES